MTEWVVPETPVPVTPIVTGEFVALLEIVTVPLCAAAVCGSKLTFNVALCPAASAAPLTPPPVVKSGLDTLIPDTITGEFPVFFKLTVSRLLFPTVSLPKLRLVGVAVMVLVAATPVPLILITRGTFGAATANVSVPFKAPLIVGVRARWNCVVAPTANVSGVVRPLSWYWFPAALMVAPVMVTLWVPMFLS
jgi:hypothetical protein